MFTEMQGFKVMRHKCICLTVRPPAVSGQCEQKKVYGVSMPIAMCTRTFVVRRIHVLHDCRPLHLAHHGGSQQHLWMHTVFV